MTVTKRQKRLLIALLSVFCLLAVLFSLFWFVPYRRHWNFRKTPVETTVLFPMPDEVILIQDGKAQTLDEAQIPAIYEAFAWLDSAALGTDSWQHSYSASRTNELRREEFCVELRYKQRYKYVGEHAAFYGEEYDALLIVKSGTSCIIPYKGCTYRAVGRRSYCLLTYYDDRTGKNLSDEAKKASDYIKSFYNP